MEPNPEELVVPKYPLPNTHELPKDIHHNIDNLLGLAGRLNDRAKLFEKGGDVKPYAPAQVDRIYKIVAKHFLAIKHELKPDANKRELENYREGLGSRLTRFKELTKEKFREVDETSAKTWKLSRKEMEPLIENEARLSHALVNYVNELHENREKYFPFPPPPPKKPVTSADA